jgi:hypothetical protein
MANQVQSPRTHDLDTGMEIIMESQCEADHAHEEAPVNSWSVGDDEMETQSEADQSDDSESDSDYPLANDSGAKCKGCWKLIFLWKMLSFMGLLASLFGSSMTEESVDIASMFNLDVECCADQAAGSTALCTKANVSLPCESLVSDAVSKELTGNSSSFALGMSTFVGQDAGGMQISGKAFSRKPDTCKLVASLMCKSEFHNSQMWKNASQVKAISLDSQLPINSPPHNIWQRTQEEEIAKSSIPQWCPLWPSIGVSSVLLAISVKVMF